MKDLLTAMVAAISDSLNYLRWVGVIDSELLPNDHVGYPQVGLLEGGSVPKSMPGRKDLEELTVQAIVYQSIIESDPGGSIMGSGRESDFEKGVLDITSDLIALLNDNFLSQEKIHYAHCDLIKPSQPLVGPDSQLVSFKPLVFRYRRYV